VLFSRYGAQYSAPLSRAREGEPGKKKGPDKRAQFGGENATPTRDRSTHKDFSSYSRYVK